MPSLRDGKRSLPITRAEVRWLAGKSKHFKTKEENKMKSLRQIFIATLFILASSTFLYSSAFAQNEMFPGISPNKPSVQETVTDVPAQFDEKRAAELEEQIKMSIESGQHSRASELRRELKSVASVQKEIFTEIDRSAIFDNSESREVENDWALGAPVIVNGEINSEIQQYHRQIEMKMGEDGNIYVAVNRAPAGSMWKAKIDVYRSSNGGKTWINCGAVTLNTQYIFSMSMTIESRDNSVPDSTRINIFYTSSTNTSNTAAKLNFGTFRRNGTSPRFVHVSDPNSYFSFHSLSAVSDGAFWSSAAYFGVVTCESDLTETAPTRLRFFRTTNWGASFTYSEILTNYVDYYPSAQFFNSTTDEVWIAVERRFTNEKQVRMIRTPWSVSSSFTTQFITSGAYEFEKPCLSVKQNNPCDTAVLTCTRNNIPLYNFTTNGGSAWVVNHALTSSAATDKAFTWCSSTSEGATPFTFLYATNDGQEISVREGAAGYLELGIHYMVNSNQISTVISPVCATRQTVEGSLAVVAYAGSNGQNAYCDSEGHKFINLKLALQGLYDPTANHLSVNDVVSIVVKDNNAPFVTVDSVTAMLEPASMTATSSYPTLSPVKLSNLQSNNSYYIVVRHRNSLETWSSVWVPSYLDTINYDFSSSLSKAFGSNMKQVDNSPSVSAIVIGDVNQDGTIDGSDLSMIDNDISDFASGYRVTDLNGDEFIDASDAAIADNNAYMFVSVSKP